MAKHRPQDVPQDQDVRKMNELAAAIRRWLEERTRGDEAAVVAAALILNVRRLLEQYPADVRALLAEGAIAFLQWRDVETEIAGEDTGFILPPDLQVLLSRRRN